jgi:cyclophilin family peptidyl-prolyl cis-trans isomerase
VQRLSDPEVGVAVNAIRGLQQIADSSCGTCLASLAARLDAPHPYVRVTAASALAERFAWTAADSTSRQAALAKVRAHLEDPDAATRGACARVMAARGALDAVGLVGMLSDSSVFTRAAVVQALALLPPAESVPFLRGRMRPGVALLERMTAAEALGSLGAREASWDLVTALADTSVLFAGAAASALAGMRDTSAVPALARAYEAHAADADADTRVSLRDALRDLAGARFADSLERAHPSPSAGGRYDADFFAAPDVRGAVLHTSKGDIEWAFQGEVAPQTVKNFARLASRGYFDGLVIHRVVPNFVIQDGDPSGTGSGGPGWTLRCEYNRLRYEPGMVGMALSGKDTGGSQWFITHSPQPHLNGRYTIFARVTRGMDVVQRIVQGDRVRSVELLR